MRALARLLTVWLFGLTLALGGIAVPPAAAQTGSAEREIDFAAWEETAERAEEALEADRASDSALESLRADLATWRERFETARTVNETAIATVRAQLDALGPPPEEGETEPTEIAEQRTTLNKRLAELQAPVRAAEVAWSRADGLIHAIDTRLRERQTDALLELGPSPLNPGNWPAAADALLNGGQTLTAEARTAWNSDIVRREAREKLPVVLGLLAVAALLLGRSRRWLEQLTRQVQTRARGPQDYLLGFVVSLGQVVLPVGGMIALVTAASMSGLAGPRGTLLLQTFPAAMAAFAVARWAGGRVFPIDDAPPPPLHLDAQRRLQGRITATLLGAIVALYLVLREFGDAAGWAPATLNTVLFPLILVAGIGLFRIGQLMLLHAQALEEVDEAHVFRRRIVRVVARAALVLAVIGPLLAAVGYFNAGYAIVFPMIYSLQTLAALLILQRVATELYVLLTRNRDGARDALPPVLAGFALIVLSLPVFALIWGARVTDLTELWARFRGGFSIGETRLSPADLLTFVIVFAAGYVITRLAQGTLRSTVLPKTRMEQGAQTAIVSGLGYVGIFLAAIIAITSAGIDLSSLAIVAGALSVGIGFGLQNIVSNFVSGIILLIERPVAEGDWIEVGPHMGHVRSISVRSTRIETFDRQDVIVPNADLISNSVINWTRGNLVGRAIIPVGVAYGTDTRKVARILQEIAEEQPVVLLNPRPYVYFKGFGASSLDFEVRAVLRDVTQILDVHTEVNHQIAERFAAEGIEIPFPQQDIWLRNPEQFTGGASAGRASAPPPAAGRSHLAGDDLSPGEGGGNDGDGGDR